MKLFVRSSPEDEPFLLLHANDRGTPNEEASLLKKAAIDRVLSFGGQAEVRSDEGALVFRVRLGEDVT